jgi:dUTP pyrophosphatase
MAKITVKFKKDEGAKAPSYAYKGDAGLDIFSNENIILEPMHRAAVRTGIYPEIPKGYVGLIWDKSGLSLKQGLKTMAGVIDSNYRGEIKVVLLNLSSKPFGIERGDKVCQLLVQKVEEAKLVEVSEIKTSERGEKGFGSSGIKAGKSILADAGFVDIKKAVNEN